MNDPVELFHAVAAALSAEDWDSVVALCDPISMRLFHRQLVSQYQVPVQALTAEVFLQHDPEMPREVAEYRAREHGQRFGDPAERLSRELPAFADLSVLESATPERAFALWLDSHAPSRHIARLAETHNLSPEVTTNLRKSLGGFENMRAVGAVADGQAISHILFHERMDMEIGPAESTGGFASMTEDEQRYARDQWGTQFPHVASCRRQADGSWRMLVEFGFLRVGSRSTVCQSIRVQL